MQIQRLLATISTRMALSLLHFVILSLLPFVLLPHKAISTSHHHRHRHHNYQGLKSLHFSLFQHDTINKTGYIIANGVAGPKISETTAPIGTLFVFEDPMTLTPNRTTKVVGTMEGASITSSLDGLRNIAVTKITLRMKNHKGSVSVVGGAHNLNPSDQPIVGGTGDFMFAQGYITSSLVNFEGLSLVYKIEFHIYWPPYAS